MAKKSGQPSLQYSMLIQWSDEDQVYIVTLPEFGGPKTHGESYEQAAKRGREVLELLVGSSLEHGEPLPAAAKYPDHDSV
jgi:predicted RNase H-like HicB family nuclease